MTPDPRIEVAAEALHRDWCLQVDHYACVKAIDYRKARAVVAALDAHDAALIADLRALPVKESSDGIAWVDADELRAVLDRYAPDTTVLR